MAELRRRCVVRQRVIAALAAGLGGVACGCGREPTSGETPPVLDRTQECEKALERASHRGNDLVGCDLSFRTFAAADFSGADLRKATLDHALFRDATFVGADLSGASAAGADFSGADFTDANLAHFSSGGSKFEGCAMDRVNLAHARLTGTELRGATLRAADFSDAYLSEVSLDAAVLDGANFTRASLETPYGGSWVGATCPDGALSTEASGEFCSFHKVSSRKRPPLKSWRDATRTQKRE